MSTLIAPSSVAENNIVWRLVRGLVEQAAHLGQESHVGHAVGFVDHDDLDLLEVERVLAEQVGEATGARDEHVDAAVELPALRVVADTAVDRAHAAGARVAASGSSSRQICAVSSRVGARISAVGWRLRARSMRAMSGTPNAIGLAGAGGGAAAHVAAGERVGDRRGLDVERLRDPALRQARRRGRRERRDRRKCGIIMGLTRILLIPRERGSLHGFGLRTHSSEPKGNESRGGRTRWVGRTRQLCRRNFARERSKTLTST